MTPMTADQAATRIYQPRSSFMYLVPPRGFEPLTRSASNCRSTVLNYSGMYWLRRLGFEPRLPDSESVFLPLEDHATLMSDKAACVRLLVRLL